LDPHILVPQVKFNADLKVINECLDDLITRAKETRQEEDMEALQERDYSKVGGVWGEGSYASQTQVICCG
jgi:hypothetical protein